MAIARRCSLAACLVVLAPVTVHAVVIDDFTLAPIDLERAFGAPLGYTTATQTGLDPQHVAGGVRAWRFNVRSTFQSDPPSTSAVRTGVRLEPTPHLYYDADDLLTAINYNVTYNAGATSTAQPGLNIDLAALRHNALAVDFNYALFDDDNGHFDIQAGQYKYTRVPNSSHPFRLVHPFSATVDAGSGVLKSVALGTGNGYLFGKFEIARISTMSTADADFDGDVDGGDFLIWQRNLGASLPAAASHAERVASGDANLDGVVNNVDLGIWQSSQSASATAAVPEPAGAVLATASAALLTLARRRGVAAPPV